MRSNLINQKRELKESRFSYYSSMNSMIPSPNLLTRAKEYTSYPFSINNCRPAWNDFSITIPQFRPLLLPLPQLSESHLKQLPIS